VGNWECDSGVITVLLNFRPYRMHAMRTIAINVPGVCQSVTRLRCAVRLKAAERIEVLLGLETLGDLRNIVLDGGSDFPHRFDATFTKLLWPLVSPALEINATTCTGKSLLRVCRFINARRRIVQPMIDQSNRAGSTSNNSCFISCLVCYF